MQAAHSGDVHRPRNTVLRFLVFEGLVSCNLWLPIWVLFLQDRGMGLAQVGTLDAVGWVVMALAEIPTGAVADRYGRKISLAMGALLFGVAMFAVTAHVLSPLFLLGYLLWGTSQTLFSGADMALLYDTLAAEGRAAEFRKFSGQASAVSQAAQAVGSLAGAWVARYDMALCFWVAGALSLVAAGLALTFREPPRQEVATTGSKWADFAATITTAVQLVLSRPLVRNLVLLGALIPVFPFLLTYVTLQPYAVQVAFPVTALGLVVVLTRVAAIAGSAWADRFGKRFSPGTLLTLWPAALVVCQFLLAGWVAQPSLLIFVAVALVSALVRPTLSALLNDAIPSGQRATILSLQSLLWTLALAVVEPLVLALGERLGMAFALGVSGLLLLVLVTPLLLLWRRALMRAA